MFLDGAVDAERLTGVGAVLCGACVLPEYRTFPPWSVSRSPRCVRAEISDEDVGGGGGIALSCSKDPSDSRHTGFPSRKAPARSAVLWVKVRGFVYSGDEAVGAEPSSVYRISAPGSSGRSKLTTTSFSKRCGRMGVPTGDSNGVHELSGNPSGRASSVPAGNESWGEVSFEVFDHLFRVEIGRKSRVGSYPGWASVMSRASTQRSPASFMARRPMDFLSRQTWVWNPT